MQVLHQMTSYSNWSLDTNNKSIAGGYYTFRLRDAPCRIRFEHVMHIVAPVVSERGTAFRWKMTPQLKKAFEFISSSFVTDHIAPQYQVVFGKPLYSDVIDDSFTYLRTNGIHLRLSEAIAKMESLDPKLLYTIDLELRSVGMKESRIHLDWKLAQVSVDTPNFSCESQDADYVNDDEEDDLAEPSPLEYAEALEHTKDTMNMRIKDFEKKQTDLQITINHIQDMLLSLDSNSTPANFSRVYELWTDILDC